MTTIIDQQLEAVADHEEMLAQALAVLESAEPARIAAPDEILGAQTDLSLVNIYVIYKTSASS